MNALATAEALFARLLAMDEAALGPEHTEVASTLGNMGNVLQKQGKLAEAMALYERALAINEAAYGREHTSVAMTLTNMGNVLRTQGKLAEAMALYERALPAFEALAPDHPHATYCRQAIDECRAGPTPIEA